MLKPLAGALALVLFAAPAFAAAPAGVQSTSVRVVDLDLSRPADSARLEKRLKLAAMEVCGAREASVRILKQAVVRSECYRETLAQASTAAQAALAAR
jgi:UrcA family protein